MERKSAKRKMLRRKYKHYAAAVASAAILTGAALPGIPVAKALAAEGITTSPPISSEQTTMVNKDAQKPSRQAWYKYSHRNNDDRHTYKGDGVTVRYYDHDRYDSNYYTYKGDGVTVRYLNSPVDVIKDYASIYGFDSDRDTFTFLSLSSREASIQVTKHDTGQRFRVDLERHRHSDWEIVAIRDIGY
jgi:hypothetical protein